MFILSNIYFNKLYSIAHYCTLSLSDLWVTRQDNQNKTQMVNTKIIYNLREHRRKRETIYENTEEKSTMIVWSYFQLCLWMCLGPLQSRESPPPPQNLTKLSILDLNRKPRGRYHLFIFGEGPTVFSRQDLKYIFLIKKEFKKKFLLVFSVTKFLS